MTSFLAPRASVCVFLWCLNSVGIQVAAGRPAFAFYLLRRIATLDLSEWLPNRTQQLAEWLEDPSYVFFNT